MLIYNAVSYDETWRLVGAVLYTITVVAMFASSTAYHGYQIQPTKHYLRVFDHCTIYLMIGGTMSPFILSYWTTAEAEPRRAARANEFISFSFQK